MKRVVIIGAAIVAIVAGIYFAWPHLYTTQDTTIAGFNATIRTHLFTRHKQAQYEYVLSTGETSSRGWFPYGEIFTIPPLEALPLLLKLSCRTEAGFPEWRMECEGMNPTPFHITEATLWFQKRPDGSPQAFHATLSSPMEPRSHGSLSFDLPERGEQGWDWAEGYTARHAFRGYLE